MPGCPDVSRLRHRALGTPTALRWFSARRNEASRCEDAGASAQLLAFRREPLPRTLVLFLLLQIRLCAGLLSGAIRRI